VDGCHGRKSEGHAFSTLTGYDRGREHVHYRATLRLWQASGCWRVLSRGGVRTEAGNRVERDVS
jgi:hypothetical protein